MPPQTESSSKMAWLTSFPEKRGRDLAPSDTSHANSRLLRLLLGQLPWRCSGHCVAGDVPVEAVISVVVIHFRTVCSNVLQPLARRVHHERPFFQLPLAQRSRWIQLMSNVSPKAEARHCRRLAQEFVGREEHAFLLRVAAEFDDLAHRPGRSAKPSIASSSIQP